MVVEYFLPLLIISFAYIRISYNLWGHKTPGESQDQRDQQVLKNKKKVLIKDNVNQSHVLANQYEHKSLSRNLQHILIYIKGHKDARHCCYDFCGLLDAMADLANQLAYSTKCKSVS